MLLKKLSDTGGVYDHVRALLVLRSGSVGGDVGSGWKKGSSRHLSGSMRGGLMTNKVGARSVLNVIARESHAPSVKNDCSESSSPLSINGLAMMTKENAQTVDRTKRNMDTGLVANVKKDIQTRV